MVHVIITVFTAGERTSLQRNKGMPLFLYSRSSLPIIVVGSDIGSRSLEIEVLGLEHQVIKGLGFEYSCPMLSHATSEEEKYTW